MTISAGRICNIWGVYHVRLLGNAKCLIKQVFLGVKIFPTMPSLFGRRQKTWTRSLLCGQNQSETKQKLKAMGRLNQTKEEVQF